jgi:hypothetical protein
MSYNESFGYTWSGPFVPSVYYTSQQDQYLETPNNGPYVIYSSAPIEQNPFHEPSPDTWSNGSFHTPNGRSDSNATLESYTTNIPAPIDANQLLDPSSDTWSDHSLQSHNGGGYAIPSLESTIVNTPNYPETRPNLASKVWSKQLR